MGALIRGRSAGEQSRSSNSGCTASSTARIERSPCLTRETLPQSVALALVAVHLLGMVGEAGSVATEYKKLLVGVEEAQHVAPIARCRSPMPPDRPAIDDVPRLGDLFSVQPCCKRPVRSMLRPR